MPDSTGHEYGAFWKTRKQQSARPADDRPTFIIAGRVKHTYTWEEEGKWREIAEYQMDQAKQAEMAEKAAAEKKRLEVKAMLATQVADAHGRTSTERKDWESFGDSVKLADASFQDEQKRRKEQLLERQRVYLRECEELAEEARKRREAIKQMEDEAAQDMARRDAAAAARAAEAAKARVDAVRRQMAIDMADAEVEAKRRAELKRLDQEDDVRMMHAYAAELERREKAREKMFADMRARLDKNIAVQSGTFEARYASEREIEARAIRAQEAEAKRLAEVAAKKREQLRQFKVDLRRTTDEQLRVKRELAEKAHREEMEEAERNRAARAEFDRRARDRDEKRRMDMIELRATLDKQVEEQISAQKVGLSAMEAEVNKSMLSQLDEWMKTHPIDTGKSPSKV